MQKRIPILFVCLLSVFWGCEHSMRISDPLTSPFSTIGIDHPLKLGVVNKIGSRDAEAYVEAVARALQLSGSVQKVAYPYVPGHDVDAIVYVDVNPRYRGVGTNFFVDWPGFLIFTPAWHGYSYHADVMTRVEIVSASDKHRIATFDWQNDYEFKQADIGRTWVEVGWLEWSVIPFIGGFFAMQYDTDQTEPFIRMVGPSYGNQVASRISTQLANYRTSLDQEKLDRHKSVPGSEPTEQ